MGEGSHIYKGESRQRMSQAEKNAAEEYVSGDGMWINQYLRGRGEIKSISSDEAEYLKNLDSLTDHALPKEQTLYRSVDASAIFPGITDMEYDNLQNHLVYGNNQRLVANSAQRALSRQQKEIHEKGFMSTTKDEDTAADWGGFSGSTKPVVLKIKVPKGTKGADLSGHRMAQGEILLRRGQRYRTTRVYAKNGNIYVDAQII